MTVITLCTYLIHKFQYMIYIYIFNNISQNALSKYIIELHFDVNMKFLNIKL